ncbi:MAG: FliA/WhiG family RNA polymerase sigma factor [Planctomycetota bacterium]|nr:FliA/WhiG family RNA polymerase sigma factor [Planctomycetota bacterium]
MAPRVKPTCEFSIAEESQERLKNAARRAYENQEQSVQNNRVSEFLPMVQKIVWRVVIYLKPPLSFEDLVSAGTIGLVKAARDYDRSHQAEFKTYAYIRIRGAILDELRSWSFVPENVKKQIQKTLRTSAEIIGQTGIMPCDEELAEKLGITTDELYQTFENARALHFLSIDGFADETGALGDTLASVGTMSPDQNVEHNELVNKLAEAIEQLSQKQRQVILLYYQQQLTMKQIAEVLQITEPRVSQLHAGALFSLSLKLREWNDGRK